MIKYFVGFGTLAVTVGAEDYIEFTTLVTPRTIGEDVNEYETEGPVCRVYFKDTDAVTSMIEHLKELRKDMEECG